MTLNQLQTTRMTVCPSQTRQKRHLGRAKPEMGMTIVEAVGEQDASVRDHLEAPPIGAPETAPHPLLARKITKGYSMSFKTSFRKRENLEGEP